MLNTTKIVIGFFALAVTPIAYAELTAIAGPGAAMSCGEYVKYRRQSSKIADIAVYWAQGYLSAVNTQRGTVKDKLIDIPKFETLGLLVENTCINYPTYNVWMATEIITRDLSPKIK